MTATFFVQGKPIPKARPRVTRRGTYTPLATREWEQAVRVAYQQQCRTVYFDAETPLRFTAEIVCSGKGAQALIRGDVDNFGKAIKDALNLCAYKDDAQIVESTVTKRRANKGEQLGAHVTIEVAA
jgi:Holliday junction resolvase RusA-like endonuclease